MLKTAKSSIGSSQKLSGQKKVVKKIISKNKEKDGDIVKCKLDKTIYELQIGEVYTFPIGKKTKNSKDGVFRGTLDKMSFKSGYYYDKNLESFIELTGKEENLDLPEADSASDINLEMLSNSSEEDIKDRKTAVLSTGEKKKRSKQNRDDILQFDIEADNDIMVKLIKEKINKSSITSRDVMTKTASGSNMIAGLRQRNSMTLQTFCIWCKILNCTPVISIKENS